MCDTQIIMRNLDQEIFGGAKIPHKISNPVFRYHDGNCYVAVFGYTVTRTDMAENSYRRPSRWALADIETGEVKHVWNCKENDFSNASDDVKYSMNDPNLAALEDEVVDAVLEKFEKCRHFYALKSNEFVANAKQYNESIIAITPKEFKQFYQDLAIIE